MVRSSNCSTYGVPKKVCPCSKCSTRRNNALMRGGGNRSRRKGTNPHGDGIKSNRNPKRFRS